MTLIDLWLESRDQVFAKEVRQIIAFAGEGRLTDGNSTSSEFREFLTHVDSQTLATYANQCLDDKATFKESGFALQDIMNEVGRRLGFSVTNGLYRGKKNAIGFDGLWSLPMGHAIVVEVKTTDAYRIDLNSIAKYRKRLATSERVDVENSSILIVVGRADTGDLEAQIRGSQHAWSTRLISIDALIRLMQLREEIEEPSTVDRIHRVLIPREFTRLDEIVELLFSTAEDVRQEDGAPNEDEENSGAPQPDSDESSKAAPSSFHASCVGQIERHLKCTLVRRTRSAYSTPDETLGVTCAVSKRHPQHGGDAYWFAFHPYHREFLKKRPQAYVTFGCGSADSVLAFPYAVFEQWLENSWTTVRDNRFYWHVRVQRRNGKIFLNLRKSVSNPEVSEYLISRPKR